MTTIHLVARYALAFAAACSLVAAATSHAASRFWSLQGVNFEDGAIAYGSFAYDDVTRVVTSWNISVTDIRYGAEGQLFEFTYMPGNSVAFVNTNWSTIPTIYFTSNGAGRPPYARTLRLTPNQVLDGAPTTVPLDVAIGEGNVECIDCDPLRLVVGGSLVYSPLPPAVALVEVVEYYNASYDHYFMTAIPQEIALIDGGLIPGWTRTGHAFFAYATGSGGGGLSTSPVCRFYSNPATSHFYSAIALECRYARVDIQSIWGQEAGNVFQVEMPDLFSGACPAGTVPVYRVFNNQPLPNHRYTTSLVVRAQMEAAGWVREGYGPDAVNMCSPAPTI